MTPNLYCPKCHYEWFDPRVDLDEVPDDEVLVCPKDGHEAEWIGS